MDREATVEGPRAVGIVLVHGTWGRGLLPQPVRRVLGKPLWFEPGGTFRGALDRTLKANAVEPSIEAFEWSGANSILHRHRAAQRLAAAMDEASRLRPDRPNVVIAHSHGGSVAMLALRHVSAEARARLSVVTLAAPFMEIVPEAIPGRTITLLTALLVLFGLGFSTDVFVPLAHAALSAVGVAADALPSVVNQGLFVLGLALPIVAILVFLLGAGAAKRMAALVEATGDGVANDYATRMLVLRGIDDEATLALAAGALGNRMCLYLLRVVGPLLTLALAGLLYVHVGGGGPESLRANLPEIARHVLWLAIPGAGLVVVLLSGVFKSVYGRELLARSLLCQVNSHSAPDQAGRLWVITLPPSAEERRRWRHALYEHERAVNAIANWILGQLDSPAPDDSRADARSA